MTPCALRADIVDGALLALEAEKRASPLDQLPDEGSDAAFAWPHDPFFWFLAISNG